MFIKNVADDCGKTNETFSCDWSLFTEEVILKIIYKCNKNESNINSNVHNINLKISCDDMHRNVNAFM